MDEYEDLRKTISSALAVTNKEKSDMRAHATLTLTVYGGLNGHGSTEDYNKDINALMNKLKEDFPDCWIADRFDDRADDVFALTINLKKI